MADRQVVIKSKIMKTYQGKGQDFTIRPLPFGLEKMEETMWVVDKYIDYVKEQTIEDPRKSWGKMLLDFRRTRSGQRSCQRKIWRKAIRSWRP